MNNNNINHPWFVYPRGFMSEYNNYTHYRNETNRLFRFISALKLEINEKYLDNKILIPLVIGSSMEDALAKSNTSFEDNYFQHRQLFPCYINKFIEKYYMDKKFIQVIIISPDNIFLSNHKPYFTILDNYRFIETEMNEYVYTDENITIKVNIFNCPMPCINTNKNTRLELVLKSLPSNPFEIETYEQNYCDLEFIQKFYLIIDELFSQILTHSVYFIINSWVCFKNIGGCAEKFGMFPELLNLANKYNIIATEWNFIDELFFTIIVSNYKFENKILFNCKIDYVFDGDLKLLPDNILKMNFNYLNLYVIEFDNDNLLKKIN